MKKLLKSEVCGTHEQCYGIIDQKLRLEKKKKKEEKTRWRIKRRCRCLSKQIPGIDLPNNMTDMFELCLGLPGLGIGSTVSEGFHLGSSLVAHNFVSDDDSDFNLYCPSKKMRKSWSNLEEEICLHLKKNLETIFFFIVPIPFL